MKILAIDVGTGTEDILLYDSEKEIENSMNLSLRATLIQVLEIMRGLRLTPKNRLNCRTYFVFMLTCRQRQLRFHQ